MQVLGAARNAVENLLAVEGLMLREKRTGGGDLGVGSDRDKVNTTAR